jgi:peroxin-5
LEQGGSLSEAALLFEAAIQQGELGEGGYEAWILLGETRNMDEREELGLRALTEGVRRSEAANANGEGMLVCVPLWKFLLLVLITGFFPVPGNLIHE